MGAKQGCGCGEAAFTPAASVSRDCTFPLHTNRLASYTTHVWDSHLQPIVPLVVLPRLGVKHDVCILGHVEEATKDFLVAAEDDLRRQKAAWLHDCLKKESPIISSSLQR
eukprot:355810-Chlamydomonas_euryale.AAC.4